MKKLFVATAVVSVCFLLLLALVYRIKTSKVGSVNPECEISGKVSLPSDVRVKFSELEVSYGMSADGLVDEFGNFCIKKENLNSKDREIGTDISVMIPPEGEKPWTVIASATIFPEEHYIEISSRSTAASLVHTFFIKQNNKENKKMYDNIYATKEVVEFEKYLNTKLTDNPYFLNPSDLLENKEYQAHIQEVVKAIALENASIVAVPDTVMDTGVPSQSMPVQNQNSVSDDNDAIDGDAKFEMGVVSARLALNYNENKTYSGFVLSSDSLMPINNPTCVTETKLDIHPDGQSYVLYRPICATALMQSFCLESENTAITQVSTEYVRRTYHCE